MYITTKEELKEYILRQLGSESHRVEISDANFNDIYNKSLDYFYEHANDGVNRKLVIIEANGQRELTLNENIMTIKYVATDNSAYTTVTPAYYKGVSPIYDLLRGDVYDTSTYLIFTETIKEYQKLFNKKIDYSFNTQTKTFIINEDDVSNIMLDYYEAEDESLVYENELFQKLLERDCWKQWKINTQGKYIGSTIGNGVEINGEFMMTMYNQLDEEIKESVINEEYDFLFPTKIK